ncbi:MAG: YhjD/YihY/BrkB family envelope integrity protein, partial [Acidimicrobiales bacterium]
MDTIKRVLLALDRWQRDHPFAAVPYAVVKKFGDDQANLYVVNLGWYGFTAIYPLLLAVIAVFAFLGSSLGSGIVTTLHQFPVIGADFKPGQGSASLHRSVFGLVVGVVGLLYGAQGVTQTTYATMNQVWNVPQYQRSGFLTRLGRSVAELFTIGGAFLINAFVSAFIGGHGQPIWLRILLTVGLVVLNIGLFWASFWILTPPSVSDSRFLPGAVVGAVGFTALTTVGTGLVEHQLRHVSNTYGAFGSVLALVTYLLLLAKLTVFAAELNPVLARRLWPRALPMAPPTEADDRVMKALVAEE